ncbi:MAG: hypothetical protein Q9M44_01395 [Ghiorsea sp.]|nr:hypothetical protein [Ghiorsea sp.]
MSQNDNVTSIHKNKGHSFLQCFSIYFKIAFFKASPEELPFNLYCTIKALLIYAAINLFLLDSHSSFVNVLLRIFIELGLLTIFVYLGLKIKQTPERFFQTLSALIGIGMVISLISAPLFYVFFPQFLSNEEVTQDLINVTVILLIWNLAAISHVFKRSFEINSLMAAILSFNFLILFEVLVISLSSGKA